MECLNQLVLDWVTDINRWLEPTTIKWIDGSESESKEINTLLVKSGEFTPLNSQTYPNCFWSRSQPSDVARVEDRTFICTEDQREAGPTNNWAEKNEMYQKLRALMAGAMRGRTMYVIPYLMGPNGSPYSKVGFQLTDSPYVVANMRIMARVGDIALKNLPINSADFVRGVHSIGDLNPEKRYIAHFPTDNTIISFNSNYGGNALQGKKCFSLRIASAKGRNEGWLAEHMLIIGVTTPQGKKHYISAAFPSQCGKTNLAMLIPPKSYIDKGWKVETIGDDIAWLNYGSDGRLYAINPEAGFFGVAPGTSQSTNPNAMVTIRANTIFTNTALDLDKMEPWWEGMSATPKHLKDWLGNTWDPDSGTKAAHPNSRFTAPAAQCPSIAPEWESPNGVPLSAIIFGGRRPRTIPLVFEAFDWKHGTFLGVTMSSETTAAATGVVGKLRHDPMAMLPFIGYNAGDYFKHWLEMGSKPKAVLPRIFHVNWFRKSSNGSFLWPGFGENMRVLEWIINRIEGISKGQTTPIGIMPAEGEINTEELNLDQNAMQELFKITPEEWQTDILSQNDFFAKIGDSLPSEITQQQRSLKERLGII